MTNNDLQWFQRCVLSGHVRGPFLEIGSAKVQGIPNLCDLAASRGVSPTVGADLSEGDGVDVVIDFSKEPGAFDPDARLGKSYETVVIFNVLEHTFNPIQVTENAAKLVSPGGTLLLLTPSVWQIHEYPKDYCRLLPDWYEAVAERIGFVICPDLFCWVSEFGIEPITGRNRRLPSSGTRLPGQNTFKVLRSRIVHKVFNTYGRGHWGVSSAIGCAMSRKV